MIVFAYQFGSLILPAVVPAVAWVLTHRAFPRAHARAACARRAVARLTNARCGKLTRYSSSAGADHRCRMPALHRRRRRRCLHRARRALVARCRLRADRRVDRVARSGLMFGAAAGRAARALAGVLAGAASAPRVFSLAARSGPHRCGRSATRRSRCCRRSPAPGLRDQVAPLPLALERPRELAALVVGAFGASPLVGGVLGAGVDGRERRRRRASSRSTSWALSNFVGALLVAPVIVAWAASARKRSGGLTMPQFVARRDRLRAVPRLAADPVRRQHRPARFGGSIGDDAHLPADPVHGLVALTWGTRGATLAAFAGALIALVNTAHGDGPFARRRLPRRGQSRSPGLRAGHRAHRAPDRRCWRRAQRNAVARGARLADALRGGDRRASADRVRMGSRRPARSRSPATRRALVGVPPARIATLADWLAHVAPRTATRSQTAFALRADGGAMTTLALPHAARATARRVALSDEAQAIRDHDGSLHRIIGIVRAS